MSEKETIQDSKGTPAALPPPATETKTAPPAEPKVEAKTNGEAKTAPPTERPAPKRVQLTADDDEIPADADLVELSQRALRGRLERFSRKQLKDRFGVDSYEDIEAKLKRAAELEEQEETRRLAAMSETDRLREELATERRRRESVETRYHETTERQALEKEDRRVVSVMEKYIHPKMIRRLVPDLAAHIASLTDDDLKNPEKVIEAWCEEQIQELPQLARDFKTTVEAPTPKVALTTGTDPSKKPTAANPSGQSTERKTPRPGQPNSMTKGEYQAYLRELGLQY
jgi:hypothetical protein